MYLVPNFSNMSILMPWSFNHNKQVSSSQNGNYPNTFQTSKNVLQKALKMNAVVHMAYRHLQ